MYVIALVVLVVPSLDLGIYYFKYKPPRGKTTKLKGSFKVPMFDATIDLKLLSKETILFRYSNSFLKIISDVVTYFISGNALNKNFRNLLYIAIDFFVITQYFT